MTLSNLAVQRLTKAADYMQALPKSANKHFQMDSWFAHIGSDDHGFDDDRFITRHTMTLCGTVACAAGWLATMPALKRAGLKVDTGGALLTDLEEFFDIDNWDRWALFINPQHIKTPKQWAQHCRKFLRDNA